VATIFRPGAAVAAAVAARLRNALDQGNGSQLLIEDAATSLGLSVRTLQRRLTEAGLSYTALRNQVRLEKASRLIQDPDAQLIDVAYQLGFSDPGHFTRAFKRWTGLAPRQFRQRM
jgi:AraC-like DNA-binding protein